MMRLPFLLLLLCALALAACGPLPRPFQPQDKAAANLQAPSTRAPLRIGSPAGEAFNNGRDFTLRVSEQLLTLGVPAEPHWFSRASAPALETQRLQSKAALKEAGNGSERLEVEWLMISPRGEERSLALARLYLPQGAWQTGQEEAVKDAAYVSAATIARALGRALPSLDQPEAEAAPRLVVLPVEGATGDGAERLETAIARALQEKQITLAAVPRKQDFLLWCKVTIGPVQAGMQLVEVQWRLEQAADFAEIGTVTQENLVSAYSLAGAWRDSADEIAQAAADGIAGLMQQAGISTGTQGETFP